jgi:hypothetical protein
MQLVMLSGVCRGGLKLLRTKQAGSKGRLLRHLASFVLLYDSLWLLRVAFYVINFSF